jgi:MFS family permease
VTFGRGTFASLRNHRNYRLYFVGQMVSMTGNQMQVVADAWLILKLTNTSFSLGILAVAQFLPFTLLGLLAGVVVDRSDPQRLLIATQCALMSLTSTMAALVLTGTVRPWHVYTVAALAGAIRVLEGSARQTLLVQMVGRSELPNAIALTSSIFSAGRIIGPSIGGVLIAGVGTGWVYGINAVTFLPVLAVLVALRRREFYELVRHGRPQMFRGIVEAFAHVRRTPVALTVLLSVMAFSFFMANSGVYVPALARGILGGHASLFGFLMSCLGVGSTIGALFSAMLGRASRRVFVIGGAGMGISEVLVAVYPRVWSGALLLVVGGAFYMLWTSNGNAIVQLTAPDSLQGRASALYTFAFVGVSAFGGLFLGALASVSGILLYAVGGSLGLAASAVAAVRLRTLEIIPAAAAGERQAAPA